MYRLMWGDPAPFNGYSDSLPQRWVLLGIYYGYRANAIADSFTNLLGHPLKRTDRTKLLRGIAMIRNGSVHVTRLKHAKKKR